MRNIFKNLLKFLIKLFEASKDQDKSLSLEEKSIEIPPELIAENKPVDSSQVTKKEDFQDVLSKFEKGVANLATDSNTIRLRKIIKDEFGGGRSGWDLQCTEYAQFKIQQLGTTIKWPADRPRHGGMWAGIFEKRGLYKVLDSPKAGCAMCFTAGFKTPAMNETGHVAFIEQVFDDESVKITEANWPPPGKYNERRVSKVEWQDKHKCRFIDFL